MSNTHIFISHTSKDDGFVKELREALENYGLIIWADSRNLRGGAKLAPEIEEAIENARQFIVVISPNTINSPWVRKEIQKALEIERTRKDEGYHVIPLLLPGVEPSALLLWFDEEPVGVRVEIKAGGLSEALPQILTALGERLPTDRQPIKDVTSQPVEELILRLDDLKIEMKDGKRRAQAVGQLIYEPADKSARAVESKRFVFTAPLGVIEAEELRWYLEEYFVWPIGVFKERAERIEMQLPGWGQDLYQAALATPIAQEALTVWQQAGTNGERRFSVQEAIEGASKRNDKRTLATSKFQLGYVNLLQMKYAEALEIYAEARGIFESLGEPESVAAVWHQIGMVHSEAAQFEQAERAYRQSLVIKVQQKKLAGEASSLAELGNLYAQMGRLEEAVRCQRQASDIYAKLQNQRYEGFARGNLAKTLLMLQRYDEARRELHRAIECDKPYGHASQPWKTWNTLCDLEQTIGNSQAAAQARQRAIKSYLDYRLSGGQSMSGGAQLCAMAVQAITQADTTEIEQVFAQLSGEDIPPSAKVMTSKLQDILRGDRNPVLANDPNLGYDDAAELQLLLETLGAK
jgi:tetratricopeptide (TPR) repeat protein